MIKNRIAKIAALTVGMTFALSVVATPASALTIAELQAQINALMAQLASLQGGSSVSTGTTFTQNLTIGSTGAEVSALQQLLVSQGHLVMPAGVSMGYFGTLTQSALAKWQAANGVSPAAGYFGPITRAKVNAMGGSTVPGTTVGGTVGISTPGVEGTLTASSAATPASGTKVYEGDSKRAVLGIELEAKTSDIKVERIKLKLDAATSGNSDQQFYTKVAERIYVMSGSSVLASAALDANTVVKEGSDYYITISGFSYIVPKDSTKVLTIALDAKASWDSTYDNDSWTLTVPVDSVRGIDGAGINQYSPSTSFNNSFTSTADIVDSASLTISLANSSPATSQVIANEGPSDNELDGLALAKFDFKADKDNVLVTDLVIALVRGGGTVATATTAYIYDGDTLIDSATVAGSSLTAATATFSDIDWTIPADTTRTLTLKVDIDSAALASDTYSANIGVTTAVATAVTSENSAGTSITETGTAQGKTLTIRKAGPEVTLVSKSITTNGVPQSGGSSSLSTSTITATFNIKVKALGDTITLGTVASGTPVVASTTTGSLTGGSFHVYRNGAFDSTISSNSTSTSYIIPSTCTSVGTNSCSLSDGNEVTIPVTFQIQGRKADSTPLSSGLYSIGFEGIEWFNSTSGSVQYSTFMAGEADWRTSDVSFP